MKRTTYRADEVLIEEWGYSRLETNGGESDEMQMKNGSRRPRPPFHPFVYPYLHASMHLSGFPAELHESESSKSLKVFPRLPIFSVSHRVQSTSHKDGRHD